MSIIKRRRRERRRRRNEKGIGFDSGSKRRKIEKDERCGFGHCVQRLLWPLVVGSRYYKPYETVLAN